MPCSEAVIAASVKSCTVIVLDILFQHPLWSSALDLDFTLQWFWHHYFTASLEYKYISLKGDTCKCQTLHSNFLRDTLHAYTMMLCPWPRFPARLTLSWFYVESSIKVCCREAVIAESVKPCIVIVFDILFKHTLWPSVFDQDFALQWFCHHLFTSSLALKCVSLKRR